MSNGEIVKANGEIIEAPQEPEQAKYHGASSAPVTPEQAAILARPFLPEELQIIPDSTGSVYPPQVQIRRRLTEAFGQMGWSMIPVSRPGIEKDPEPHVYQVWQLWVGGRFVSEAMGEQAFKLGFNTLSLATAVEGAKSNALMRLCKDLLVGSECWDKDYTTAWKAQYAETYRDSKGRIAWRKKGEKAPVPASVAPPRPREMDDMGNYEDQDTSSSGFPEGAFVTSIEAKEWTNPKGEVIPFWVITFSDGRKASTFSKSLWAAAETYKASGTPVDPVLEAGKKAGTWKLMVLEPVKM